jgi:hypothetical protein
MKQTAVEKFIQQIEEQGESWENVSIGRIQISIKVEDYLDLIEQAKEMEKQQIIDAYGIKTKSINQDQSEIITGRQYYNETFNK